MIDRFIVPCILFILPLIVLPFGVTHFETPKVVVFELLSIFLALRVVLSAKQFRIHVFVFIYCIITALAGLDLIFQSSSVAFFGNAFRLQGVFLLSMLLLFSYFSAHFRVLVTPRWVILGLLVTEFLLVLFGELTRDGRSVGTIGEPNALAGYILCLWPFLLQSRFSKGTVQYDRTTYIVIFIGLVVSGLIILFSGSRSGLIGFGIQLLFLLCQILFRMSLSKVVLLCVLVFFMSLILPSFQQTTQAAEYESRAGIWKAALIAGYEHPIFGWGVGNTEIALKQTESRLWSIPRAFYVDSSHNIFLDWWVQGGFAGLSLFSVLLYSTYRLFVIQKAVIGLTILFGLLTSLSFNPGSVIELSFLWFLIGQALFSEDSFRFLKTKPFFGRVIEL